MLLSLVLAALFSAFLSTDGAAPSGAALLEVPSPPRSTLVPRPWLKLTSESPGGGQGFVLGPCRSGLCLYTDTPTWCSEPQPCLIRVQLLCFSVSCPRRSVKGSVASLGGWGAGRPSRTGEEGLCRWRGVPLVLVLRERELELNPRVREACPPAWSAGALLSSHTVCM